jgi:hypothetical protein
MARLVESTGAADLHMHTHYGYGHAAAGDLRAWHRRAMEVEVPAKAA